jgi:hypothetical protein
MSINKQTLSDRHPQDVDKIDPSLCPLCNESNHCGNVSPCNSSQDCWCVDKTIQFSEALLNTLPSPAKNKACICKACALKHTRSN